MSITDKLQTLADEWQTDHDEAIRCGYSNPASTMRDKCAAELRAILDAEQDETADPLADFITHCKTRAGEFVAPGCMASTERASWLATAAKAAAFSDSLAAPSVSPREPKLCLRCEVPIFQDGRDVWRREATGSDTCPRNPAGDGHEPRPAPEGQPEESICDREYAGRHYYSLDGTCQRCGHDSAAPAPVPDDEVPALMSHLIGYDCRLEIDRYAAAESIIDAGWVSPEAHAAAVQEAVWDALGSAESPMMLCARLLDAADRLENPRHRGNQFAWPEHSRILRNLANTIARDLTRGTVSE